MKKVIFVILLSLVSVKQIYADTGSIKSNILEAGGDFVLSTFMGGVPLVGHSIVAKSLWELRLRSDFPQRCIIIASGLIFGSAAWYQLAQFLKTQDASLGLKAYLLATTPSVTAIGLIIAAVQAARKYRHRRNT